METGHFIKTIDDGDVFIPNKLPPTFSSDNILHLIAEASNMIGVLSGLGRRLKNPHLLIQPQIMNEAVQSSKIEGSQVSLSDLYKYQSVQKNDLATNPEEVSNYVDALEDALVKVSSVHEINLELINECHKKLLRNTRGNITNIGKLRTIQNWIGTKDTPIAGARYTPPPPNQIPKLMDNLFEFINAPTGNPVPIVRCAIVHYQFEAIHPYEDGNGRIGRMLIPLMLSDMHLLSQPLLYISGYIEQHRKKYYDALLDVSLNGNWEGWIKFFLSSIIHQAKVSINLIEKLEELRESYRKKVGKKGISGTALKTIDLLFLSPFITRRRIEDEFDVGNMSARNTVEKLEQYGILREISSSSNTKMYVAEEIYNLIYNPGGQII